MTKFGSRSPGLWAAVLPLVSGIATYVLCAGVAAGTGDACAGFAGSGSSTPVGAAFYLLIIVPPGIVTYRAVVARKSWPVRIALMVGTGILNYAAVCFAFLAWAGGHSCWG